MALTRRSSSVTGLNTIAQNASILETLESIKRKYVQQNKEIIHQNSELKKDKAELLRQTSDYIAENSRLRSENIVISAKCFQIECEMANIKHRLEKALQENEKLKKAPRPQEGSIVIDRAMQVHVNAAVQAMQLFGELLRASDGSGYSATAPSPTLSSSTATSTPEPPPNVSIARRKSTSTKAAPRTSMLPSKHDLSHISEISENEPTFAATTSEALLDSLKDSSALPWPLSSSPKHSLPSPEVSPPQRPTQRAPLPEKAPLVKPARPKTQPPKAASASFAAKSKSVRRASGLVRPPPSLSPTTTPKSPGGQNGDDSSGEDDDQHADQDRDDAVDADDDVLAEIERKAKAAVAALPPRRARPAAFASSSSSDSSDSEGPDEDGSEYVPASVRSITLPPAHQPAKEPAVVQQARKESVTGSMKPRTVRAVEPMAIVAEEAPKPKSAPVSNPTLSNSQDKDVTDENEAPELSQDGRRARKSVNYALPKLNTKMRRPEDYVPVTTAAAAKPRKSTKRTSTVHQQLGLLRATPHSDESDTAPSTAAASVPAPMPAFKSRRSSVQTSMST